MVDESNIDATLKEMRKLKSIEAKLESKRKELKERRETMMREAIQFMRDKDWHNHGVGGVMYSPTKTIYGQITDRDAFMAWAETQDETLIDWKERSALINEIARNCFDDGNPLPPGMAFRETEYISTRAS